MAIARGLRAYDAARCRLEGVATVGLGTRKVVNAVGGVFAKCGSGGVRLLWLHVAVALVVVIGGDVGDVGEYPSLSHYEPLSITAHPMRANACLSRMTQVTARLQVTGFPIFSLLPAGMGEPMAGRFEEEAREARAEMRRRLALDEIDRAKERQVRQSRGALNAGESISASIIPHGFEG